MYSPLPTPPEKKEIENTLPLHTSLQAPLAHTHRPHVTRANLPHSPGLQPCEGRGVPVTPRPGHQAQAQLRAHGGAQGRGWGARSGAGEGAAAGLGVAAFSEPQHRHPSAPRHRRTEEGKRERGHHRLEFLEARAAFAPNTEASERCPGLSVTHFRFAFGKTRSSAPRPRS